MNVSSSHSKIPKIVHTRRVFSLVFNNIVRVKISELYYTNLRMIVPSLIHSIAVGLGTPPTAHVIEIGRPSLTFVEPLIFMKRGTSAIINEWFSKHRRIGIALCINNKAVMFY